MPFSFVQYPGNGSTVSFAVPFPYLLRSHVRLYYGLNFISGGYTQLLADGTDYNWNTGGTQITLTSPPGSGALLTIRRETPTANRLVDFADGSNLIEQNLDTAGLQTYYVVQELYDYIEQLSISPGGNVPDNSITTSKVANRAITSEKLANDVLAVFAAALSLRSGTVLVLRGDDGTAPIRFQDGAGNEIGYLHNEGWYRGTGIRNLSGPLALLGNNTSAPIRFLDGAAIEIAGINNAGVFYGTGVVNFGGSFIYRGNDATYPHLFKDGANNNIAGLTNAGALTALSDKSLKTSINDLDYGLAAINALRPVVYKLLSEVERADELKTECPTRLGFVAQDVQKVIPELTIEMGDKLALEQTGIIPVLVKAVQELSEQVTALQTALNLP